MTGRLAIRILIYGQCKWHAESARSSENIFSRAPFIFTSTNKVYGDTPNRLPLQELSTRWEIEPGHAYEPGISETMSIDYSKHSLFGASKAAADLLCRNTGVILDCRLFLFAVAVSPDRLMRALSCTVFFRT